MAIIHVTTADEFISALGDANEVYIDNDIDFNGYQFTAATTVRGVTVHGQGHNLSNIQYAYNGPRFSQATSTSYWDEVNFVNCLCQNTYDAAFFDGRNGGMVFDKCKFQGKFFNFTYRSVYFTKCSFAFEPGLAWMHWSDGSGGSYEQCYIDLKEQNGHQLTQQVSIKNCYFKGTITGQNAPLFNAGYQVFVNNVINIELINSGTFQINYGGNPETVSIYNATKAAGATITPQNHIVGLPDSDMHVESAADVQRVSEAIAATGFPIVY